MAFGGQVAPSIEMRARRRKPPLSAAVSAVMRANRSKGTELERRISACLTAATSRRFITNDDRLPGSPDFAFYGAQLAIFAHGCFWHACLICDRPRPRHNATYWSMKVETNVKRDRRVARSLRSLGWGVLTIRECRFRKNPDAEIRRIIQALNRR